MRPNPLSITYTIPSPREPDDGSEKAAILGLALEGLHRRYSFDPSNPQTDREREFMRRLYWEIEVVTLSGKVNQFLMMRDIVCFADAHDIPVSPGYGLAPGSLLAFALYITKVDPYRYDLIYEGSPFLGATLGINISAERCEEVIRYVKKQYRVEADSNAVELTLVEMSVLDVVHDILNRIRQTSGDAICLDNIPLDDKATFELLRRGDTLGVYQLESKATRRYLQEWAPASLSDIFALTALNRFGAKDLIPLAVACKNKETPVSFHHPLLEPVTTETHGIFIYQGQVIRAAKILAGYTSEQGDSFRRVLSRKQPDKTAEERLKFADACGRVNGIAPYQANLLFDVLDGCSLYAFRKPHAVAHGLLTYQMAYLKTHFRTEFEGVRKQK